MTHQVRRPPEEHGVQVAFLEALVQRGGASTGQRSEGVCIERSRCSREVKLYGQVRNQHELLEGRVARRSSLDLSRPGF